MEAKIICPYCSTEFTPEMLVELDRSSGCNTCGTGDEIEITIDILCQNKDCRKLVYRKEVVDYC